MTTIEDLHAHEAMVAYRKADKKQTKYKSALDEIEKICLEQNLKKDNIARDILCIIDKVKEKQ